MMLTATNSHNSAASGDLSIAIVGPDEERRRQIVLALRGEEIATELDGSRTPAPGSVQEFFSYPVNLDELPKLLAHNYDVVFVDLDSDPDYALRTVAAISDANSATVMVYAAQADRDLVIRSMRAGAREFLSLPLAPGDMCGALAHVPAGGLAIVPFKASSKRQFVFMGAKGGCGVTTIASNFAVWVARESGQATLLIDLGLPLGDAAICLGMACNYSTANAFEDWRRLDGNFLGSLLAEHASGLQLLAAPGEFPGAAPPMQAIDKLLAIARQCFQYVIVDIGSRADLLDSSLFDEWSNPYLVAQPGISDLRNANRMITQLFAERNRKLQIVINRYAPQALGFGDDHIAKALTRPAHWKVPDEDSSGNRTRRTLHALAPEESTVARAIRLMARAACGLPALQEKRSFFSLRGRRRA